MKKITNKEIIQTILNEAKKIKRKKELFNEAKKISNELKRLDEYGHPGAMPGYGFANYDGNSPVIGLSTQSTYVPLEDDKDCCDFGQFNKLEKDIEEFNTLEGEYNDNDIENLKRQNQELKDKLANIQNTVNQISESNISKKKVNEEKTHLNVEQYAKELIEDLHIDELMGGYYQGNLDITAVINFQDVAGKKNMSHDEYEKLVDYAQKFGEEKIEKHLKDSELNENESIIDLIPNEFKKDLENDNDNILKEGFGNKIIEKIKNVVFSGQNAEKVKDVENVIKNKYSGKSYNQIFKDVYSDVKGKVKKEDLNEVNLAKGVEKISGLIGSLAGGGAVVTFVYDTALTIAKGFVPEGAGYNTLILAITAIISGIIYVIASHKAETKKVN